jgi:hypothetical protein
MLEAVGLGWPGVGIEPSALRGEWWRKEARGAVRDGTGPFAMSFDSAPHSGSAGALARSSCTSVQGFGSQGHGQ